MVERMFSNVLNVERIRKHQTICNYVNNAKWNGVNIADMNISSYLHESTVLGKINFEMLNQLFVLKISCINMKD